MTFVTTEPYPHRPSRTFVNEIIIEEPYPEI
jgi:hypothetical protein